MTFFSRGNLSELVGSEAQRPFPIRNGLCGFAPKRRGCCM